MYADTNSVDKTILYQGDIIDDFPFHVFQNNQPVKKNEAGYFESNQDWEKDDSSLFIIERKKQKVMILSQSCDIQRRSNVILCPVYELEQFISDNTINTNRAKQIRERKIYYWFYLPKFEGLPESLADLQTMVYISRNEIEKYLPKRKNSLSDLGRHHLAWSLATYFGRPSEK